MRIAYDATPAALQQAGVGRYARELLKALVSLSLKDVFVVTCAASRIQADELLDQLPPGALRDLRRLPVPERYLTALWQRVRLPLPVERVIGEFDLFHATDFVAPPSRNRVVATVHDLSFMTAPQYGHPALVSFLRTAVPRTIARADAVIAVSATIAAELADTFPAARSRIAAVPNGVSVPDPPRPREPSVRPTVLIVGTLEPRKNHAALFDSMQAIRAVYPDALLIVAGRVGWLSEPIIEQLSVLVRQGVAEFVEAPSDAEIDALYRRADVCVVPSHYEGFGLPVLEALARGTPVVASDIPALRETGGTVAVYAGLDEPGALAQAIIELLRDDQRRQRLGALGIARARIFSWGETAKRTRNVYERVMAPGTR